MESAQASWGIGAAAGAPIRAQAEVLRNLREGAASWRLALRVPGWPGFRPGQFAMLSPGAQASAPRSDPLLPRPMAVFRADARIGEIEILYKRTGRGTALLSEALPGQRVAIVGPLGAAFREPRPGERVAIVAGGTGIASVYALAAQLRSTHRVELFFGARSADELMAIADFEALGVSLDVATDDGSRGARGLVTQRLERALAARAREPLRVYACGPNAMLRRCAELAAQHHVPCEVALENRMACGFGVCLGCAAPLAAGGYALVCRDGPAFDAAAIDWGRLP